jgi:exodeoxyribonuclease VII small subunit
MAKSANSKSAVTLEALLNGEVSEQDVEALTFEAALKLLEEVVVSVESGALPLDRAIGSYERGTLLIKHLRKLLSGAEEKLRILNQG